LKEESGLIFKFNSYNRFMSKLVSFDL